MEGNDMSKGKSKKLIAIVLVCVIIVAVASLVAFTLLPPFDGDTPTETGYLIRMNYDVGEKLIYEMDMTAIVTGMEEEETVELTCEMEVLDFDGENYTIQQTLYFEGALALLNTGKFKMDQTGYVVEYVECNLGYFTRIVTLSSVPTFGAYFPEEEVKLGESWENVIELEGSKMGMSELDLDVSRFEITSSGTAKYTLSEVSNETLKIDYEASVYMAIFDINAEVYDMTMSADINGTVYIDAVTYRLIEFTYSESDEMMLSGETMEGEGTTHGWLVTESETPEPEPEPESEIVRLNNIIENLKSEAVVSDNEIYLRDRQIDDLEGQISSLNYQINDLNNQINDLRAPRLVNVGLSATDNQLTHTLHIYGWVFNVGHVDVQSSRLHVVAYHRDGTVAIDTYVDLGPVHAVASKRVAVQIAYEGLPIEMSRVTMTPEWS